MLRTPTTSNLNFDRIYEPSEDSFLLMDTLSSEKLFLHDRFGGSVTPFIVEIGTGSGVVITFIHSNVEAIIGRSDVITVGLDANPFACTATLQTIKISEVEQPGRHAFYSGSVMGDLTGAFRMCQVDLLIFNPPYVPTEELPRLPTRETLAQPSFEDESQLLELSYAGGIDGMETTQRLLDSLPDVLSKDRGCAYVLLCAQNKPEAIKERIRNMGAGWQVETVGRSGKRAGWESLQIIRIWRDATNLPNAPQGLED